MMDRLIEAIGQKKTPLCLQLGLSHRDLPGEFTADKDRPQRSAARALFDFGREVLDSVNDLLPAVLLRSADYLQYGPAGMKAMARTADHAKKVGLVVILDAALGGGAAEAQAGAYLTGVKLAGKRRLACDCDFVTVDPYAGSEGIEPLLEACRKRGRGLFVYTLTGGEFQRMKIYRKTLAERVADQIDAWGAPLMGEYGCHAVGAVVSAREGELTEKLRRRHPATFFLVPPCTAAEAAACFDEAGQNALLLLGREVLTAYRGEEGSFKAAIRRAVLAEREQIETALAGRR